MSINYKTTPPSKSWTKTILISLAIVYIAAQLVMPKLGYSLALNFDTSCYSGAISFLERVNTGSSSCGASGNFIGFPFVINFAYNTSFQKILTALLDFLPLIVGLGIFKILEKNHLQK